MKCHIVVDRAPYSIDIVTERTSSRSWRKFDDIDLRTDELTRELDMLAVSIAVHGRIYGYDTSMLVPAKQKDGILLSFPEGPRAMWPDILGLCSQCVLAVPACVNLLSSGCQHFVCEAYATAR